MVEFLSDKSDPSVLTTHPIDWSYMYYTYEAKPQESEDKEEAAILYLTGQALSGLCTLGRDGMWGNNTRKMVEVSDTAAKLGYMTYQAHRRSMEEIRQTEPDTAPESHAPPPR